MGWDGVLMTFRSSASRFLAHAHNCLGMAITRGRIVLMNNGGYSNGLNYKVA